MLLSSPRSKFKPKFLLQPNGGATIRTSLFSSSNPHDQISSTTGTITTTLLQKCNSLIQTKLIHQLLLVRGLYQQHFTTRLVSAYLTYNAPYHSVATLERLNPSSSSVLFCWNTLIRRSLRLGLTHDVLSLFRKMIRLRCAPDHYTFPSVFNACGELPSFRTGAAVHGAVSTIGFDSDVKKPVDACSIQS